MSRGEISRYLSLLGDSVDPRLLIVVVASGRCNRNARIRMLSTQTCTQSKYSAVSTADLTSDFRRHIPVAPSARSKRYARLGTPGLARSVHGGTPSPLPPYRRTAPSATGCPSPPAAYLWPRPGSNISFHFILSFQWSNPS